MARILARGQELAGTAPGGHRRNGDDFLAADSWSPDGRTLLYGTQVPDRSWDQLLFSLEDGSSRTVASSPEYDAEASFSPDGKWIVYTSSESGVFQVYVQGLSEPTKSGRSRIPRDAIRSGPRSERRSCTGAGGASVAVRTEPVFEASVPETRFEGPFELETSGFRNFDVTADGQRLVMVQTDEPPLDRLVFVVSWLDELGDLFRLRPMIGDAARLFQF